jgi:hypothetical protein
MNAPAARFQPQDPAFAARVRGSFGRQKAMALIGALVAQGRVVKPGRTLTVARGDVYAEDGKHVATMQQTLLMLAGTPDTPA